MPTGFTCKVQEGKLTNAKDYILECSRNFGATMLMDNDYPNNIVYRKPSDYHLRKLEEIEREYKEFQKMSDSEIQTFLDNDYKNKIKETEDYITKTYIHKKRYLDMIEKVKAWIPPTGQHIKLKEFALSQLEESLKFDCDNNIRDYIKKQTVEEYKEMYLISYLKNIRYHSKEYEDELQSVKKSNKWVDVLVNSFN